MSAQLDKCPNCGYAIAPPSGGYAIGSGHGKKHEDAQHRRECPNCGRVLRLVEGAWKISSNE